MHGVITTAELASLLALGSEESAPAVLDVRWRLGGPPGRDSYAAGHLPGAVFVDLDTELAAPPGTRGEPVSGGSRGSGGRHPLPDPAALQHTLRAAGVRANHPVVAYDDGDSAAAARAWWLLRWAGHTEVAVLDGGFAAWQAEGRPVTTQPAQPAEGDIEVRPGGMPVLDADGAARRARDGVLLDARVPGRYRGSVEPVDPRAGHIPGARNAPFPDLTGDDGRWRTADDLAEHFAAHGVRPGVPVAAYCGSGITASAVVLGLELAGHPEPAALYAGSWSDWSADPAREAVLGDHPG